MTKEHHQLSTSCDDTVAWKNIRVRNVAYGCSVFTSNVGDDLPRNDTHWLSINQYVEVVYATTRKAHVNIGRK